MAMARRKSCLSNRIADTLRQEIIASGYEPGSAIASARELAGQYKVSVPTLHNALNQLVKEGLLYRVRGSGTYVSDSARHRNRIGGSYNQKSLSTFPMLSDSANVSTALIPIYQEYWFGYPGATVPATIRAVVHLRHEKRSNVVCFDGNVTSYSRSELLRLGFIASYPHCTDLF